MNSFKFPTVSMKFKLFDFDNHQQNNIFIHHNVGADKL